MFEGHDTTSSALAFTIYLLSKNKAVQQKAYEEINDFDSNDYDKLQYLEAVIKESLRLYPSVPFFSRITQEDLKLSNAKLYIIVMLILNVIILPNSKSYNSKRNCSIDACILCTS